MAGSNRAVELKALSGSDTIWEIPEYFEKAYLFLLVCFLAEFEFGSYEESW